MLKPRSMVVKFQIIFIDRMHNYLFFGAQFHLTPTMEIVLQNVCVVGCVYSKIYHW